MAARRSTNRPDRRVHAVRYKRVLETGLLALVPAGVTIAHWCPGEVDSPTTAREEEIVLDIP